MTNDELNRPEPWKLTSEQRAELYLRHGGNLNVVELTEEDAQRKLLEWLKIVTVKADYADIGDIRILVESDWRRLCTSLGEGQADLFGEREVTPCLCGL